MKAKKKIPLTTESTPWGGQPFSGLEIPGLSGPSLPAELETAVSPALNQPPAKVGEVIVRRETSGRSGKAVLVLSGWSVGWTREALEQLAREARQACGCGGTMREREIELQGGDSGRVRRFLENRGFRIRGM